MERVQIAQGDLLFIPVIKLPAEAKHEKGRTAIVEGEATGHIHRIRDIQKAAIYLVGTTMYLRALKKTEIDHEEHHTVVLPAGIWEVRRQQEYLPEGWRQVAD